MPLAVVTEKLPLVTLYLSERCNSRCHSCDFWKHGSRDMRLDDVRRLLPDLRALRTRSVLVSGGEPLLNPEWREIARLLRNEGIDLWLLTSGLSLAKHAISASELFRSITVSLDGTCGATYAAIRGVDAFEKVCEGIASVSALVPTGLRVTLQKANFRELPDFVTLAYELGVSQVSFLAVDVSNPHAFARSGDSPLELRLSERDLEDFDELLEALETRHADAFKTGFIAESPEKLRRLRDYFAGLLGLRGYPRVRCNAPEFSAVIGADGRVSPCFFILGPATAPRAPNLKRALHDESMQALRTAIGAGNRRECEKCVCPMWRQTEDLTELSFRIRTADHAKPG